MGRVTIIVNEWSGSAAARGTALDQAVASGGLDAVIVRVPAPEVTAAAERAATDGQVLVAAGGDGTVSTVASVAVKTGSTFGVIPLGTLNHFAKDAGIPLDVDKAMGVIAAGHTRALDVAELNGRIFVNNASLGIYPRLVWERQQEQCRGRGKWTAFAIALVRTWRRYPTVDVRMVVNGLQLARRTPFVFIGNGEYRAEGLGLGTRASLNSGFLSIYLAPGVDRFEFLRLPLRALAGRLSADVHFEAFTARELTIEPARRTVDVALDGELRSAPPPLRAGVHPQVLNTLVPRS
jgi:diacylglycerol kinase family enzyme